MFKIEKKIKGKLGRAGVIQTSHGAVETPAFSVVGTKATIKALLPEQVKDLGAEIILANTYHLYLEPGDEVVREAGGLHSFMNWNGPIMADSGGFQVFSLGSGFNAGVNPHTKIFSVGASKIANDAKNINLRKSKKSDNLDKEEQAKLVKITEDGVEFRSHIDGSLRIFTPEKSIQIQRNLGADIIFAFDECTSPDDSDEYLKKAMERTHRWAERCLDHHKKLVSLPRSSAFSPRPSALFGIVQGGNNEKLRKESAKIIGDMGFDGFGIGGSFNKEDIKNALVWINSILPEQKPRHLLGIGEPEDLFVGVENGIDTFDCVAPTRMGRNGTLYTKNGKINITKAEYKKDFTPIEPGCGCYACKNYTKAYMSHLFKAKEMLAATLASIHNLYFTVNLVKKMRQAIFDNTFFEFKDSFLRKYYK